MRNWDWSGNERKGREGKSLGHGHALPDSPCNESQHCCSLPPSGRQGSAGRQAGQPGLHSCFWRVEITASAAFLRGGLWTTNYENATAGWCRRGCREPSCIQSRQVSAGSRSTKAVRTYCTVLYMGNQRASFTGSGPLGSTGGGIESGGGHLLHYRGVGSPCCCIRSNGSFLFLINHNPIINHHHHHRQFMATAQPIEHWKSSYSVKQTVSQCGIN